MRFLDVAADEEAFVQDAIEDLDQARRPRPAKFNLITRHDQDVVPLACPRRPEQPVDFGEQIGRGAGFGEKSVASGTFGALPLALQRMRGERDDGDVFRAGVALQLGRDLPAVDPRQ